MKTISIFSLLVICSLITISANAQEKGHYISVNIGTSIPTGDFAKADAGSFGNWNNSAGFAKTGYLIGVEGAYYFTKNIGLAGNLYFSNHGGFSKSDVSKLGDSYTDAFDVDESTVTTSGSYNSINLMVGPQYSFPINKLTIDVRVLGGLLKSISTPTMTVQLEDQENATFIQKSSTASAFAWQVGAGLRYMFSDNLGLNFKVDYMSSDGVTVDNSNRVNSAGRLVTTQPMSWMNASIGMTFALGK